MVRNLSELIQGSLTSITAFLKTFCGLRYPPTPTAAPPLMRRLLRQRGYFRAPQVPQAGNNGAI